MTEPKRPTHIAGFVGATWQVAPTDCEISNPTTSPRLDVPGFTQGFKAVMPLWLAAAPFALAYSVAAQDAGLSPLETQVMSLTIFSAAAQMAAVQLLSAGAPAIAIVLTAVMMNLHHLLYGLSLARHLELSRIERTLAAYFLTDTAYAATITTGAKFSFLFGAELSMFLAWNLLTALAVLLGHFVTAPPQLGFVVPLGFFVLLISSIRTRLEVWVALISAVVTLACLSLGLGVATILVVGITGAIIGSRMAR